jgi:hypothetical protein
MRHGAGKVEHPTKKQLWVQGAVKSYGIKVAKIPIYINTADLLTHGCTTKDFDNHLKRIHLERSC